MKVKINVPLAFKSCWWWVGGGWCTAIITSALLLLFLNQDFESKIKKFEQRGAGAELDNRNQIVSKSCMNNFPPDLFKFGNFS